MPLLPAIVTVTFSTNIPGTPICRNRPYGNVLLLAETLQEDTGDTVWYRLRVPVRGPLQTTEHTVFVREDAVSLLSLEEGGRLQS